MTNSMPQADGTSVIEVESRVATCVVPGCRGVVMRHSLGGGQSVDRCIRCFRRYQVRSRAGASEPRGRLRKLIDEFVAWQDDE